MKNKDARVLWIADIFYNNDPNSFFVAYRVWASSKQEASDLVLVHHRKKYPSMQGVFVGNCYVWDVNGISGSKVDIINDSMPTKDESPMRVRTALNRLIVDETEAVAGYDEVMKEESLTPAHRAVLESIRNDEISHIAKLTKIYEAQATGAQADSVKDTNYQYESDKPKVKWQMHQSKTGSFYFKDPQGNIYKENGVEVRFGNKMAAGEFYVKKLFNKSVWGWEVPKTIVDGRWSNPQAVKKGQRYVGNAFGDKDGPVWEVAAVDYENNKMTIKCIAGGEVGKVMNTDMGWFEESVQRGAMVRKDAQAKFDASAEEIIKGMSNEDLIDALKDYSPREYVYMLIQAELKSRGVKGYGNKADSKMADEVLIRKGDRVKVSTQWTKFDKDLDGKTGRVVDIKANYGEIWIDFGSGNPRAVHWSNVTVLNDSKVKKDDVPEIMKQGANYGKKCIVTYGDKTQEAKIIGEHGESFVLYAPDLPYNLMVRKSTVKVLDGVEVQRVTELKEGQSFQLKGESRVYQAKQINTYSDMIVVVCLTGEKLEFTWQDTIKIWS